MIGLVLAAGQGQRLRPHTDSLPKTLLAVDGDDTILDVILRNLAKVDIDDITVVAGYAADALHAREAELADKHGVTISVINNERYEINNAYSLWLAREAFADGAMLINGDTVHPVDVEQALLASDGRTGLTIAVDMTKELTDEAMKVTLDERRFASTINKRVPIEQAEGEYIGATLIAPDVAGALAAALEETWRRDPELYYEDGFQALIETGVDVGVAELPPVDWVEVDYPADLERAREVACRC